MAWAGSCGAGPNPPVCSFGTFRGSWPAFVSVVLAVAVVIPSRRRSEVVGAWVDGASGQEENCPCSWDCLVGFDRVGGSTVERGNRRWHGVPRTPDGRWQTPCGSLRSERSWDPRRRGERRRGPTTPLTWAPRGCRDGFSVFTLARGHGGHCWSARRRDGPRKHCECRRAI